MSDGQWRHTAQNPRDDSYPLAPWAEHPPLEGLPRDLVADLLEELRDDVNGWAALHADGGTAHTAARLRGAEHALKVAQRLVRRAETRAAR